MLSEKMDNTAGPASYWVDEVRQLEAKIALLSKNYSALCTKCGYMRPATEIEKENAVLIKRLWDYEHQASDERIRDEK